MAESAVVNLDLLRVVYCPGGRASEFAQERGGVRLALNPWVGCRHGCVYCYNRRGRNRRPDFETPKPLRVGDDGRKGREPGSLFLDDLRHDCGLLSLIEGGAPRVFIEFAGDPYPDEEEDLLLTRRTLETLREFGIPWDLCTKAGVIAQRDFDLYVPQDALLPLAKRSRFGVTLTTRDTARAREWEPGAADPLLRIANLYAAVGNDIPLFVSCEPIMDPAETFDVIRHVPWPPRGGEVKVGLANHLGADAPVIDWGEWAPRFVVLFEAMNRKGRTVSVKAETARKMPAFAPWAPTD